MHRRRQLVNKLFAPVGLLLLSALAVAWYAWGWIPTQRQYFTNRNLRLLSSLGANLAASINNFDQVMDNAAKAALDSTQLERYFQDQVPNLILVEDDEHPHAKLAEVAGDPPSLWIEPDEGTFFLWFSYKSADAPHPGKREPAKMRVKVSIDSLIPSSQLPREFDAFFIARVNGDGAVIFQAPRQSAEVNLISLDKTLGGDGEPIDVKSILSSTVLDVWLAGTGYKLFAEPLRLSYPVVTRQPTSNLAAAPFTKTDDSEVWLLCGLVRTRTFTARSFVLSDSMTYVLWFTLAMLLVLCSKPFVKLVMSGPLARLRARDLLWHAVALFIVTGILTFWCLDLYFYGHQLDHQLDDHLMEFSTQITRHVYEEADRIWKQLEDFDVTADLRAAKSKESKVDLRDWPPLWLPHAATPQNEVCRPEWACRVEILSDQASPRYPKIYPYLQFVTWDDGMHQRIKWTVRSMVTPFLTLRDAHLPYFQELQDTLKWGPDNPTRRATESKSPGGAVDRGVSAFKSPNTGENITVFWRVMQPSNHSLDTSSRPLAVASLITQPQSLVAPVVPGDLTFAIVDRSGTVMFHTDQTKTRNENFLRECDDDRSLRALIAQGRGGKLVTNYLGHPQRLRVTPLTGDFRRWSLVVFQPLVVEETLNAEALSLASILFLFCSALVWLIVCLRDLPSKARLVRWFYPAESRVKAYADVAVMNLALAACLAALIVATDAAALVIETVLIAAIAAVFAAWRVGASKSSEMGIGRILRTWFAWRVEYQLAGASLLVVTAMLPAVAFFKVSWNFERALMVRRDHVLLGRRLEQRQARLSAQYASVKGGKDLAASLSDEVLVPEPTLSDNATLLPEYRPYSSRDVALWKYTFKSAYGFTRFEAAPTDARLPAPSSVVERGLMWMLAAVRPVYNDNAAETSAVGEDAARDRFDAAGFNRTMTSPASSAFGVLIQSDWRPWRVPTYDDGVGEMALWWGGGIVWIGLLCLMVGFVATKLQLADFCLEMPGGTDDGFSADVRFDSFPRLCVVGPPLSGKTAAVGGRTGDDAPWFDLRTLTRRSHSQVAWAAMGVDPTAAVPDGVMLNDPLAGPRNVLLEMPGWKETLRDRTDMPIVLDHFEYRIGEPGWLLQKLDLVEQLVYGSDRKVIIISSIDPTEAVPPNEDEASNGVASVAVRRRWIELFETFPRVEFIGYPPKDFDVSGLEEKIAGTPPVDRDAVTGCFYDECGATLQLNAIGVDLVADLQRGVKLTAHELLNVIAIRAEPYYRSLWTSCTKDEQLTLVQLAEEGILNPKSVLTAQTLLRKRLIACDDVPRLMNETFRRFVLGALPRSTVSRWELEEGLPWDRVLLIGVGALTMFLFFTQQDVAKAWVGYVAGAATAIPALFNALAGVRVGWRGSKT